MTVALRRVSHTYRTRLDTARAIKVGEKDEEKEEEEKEEEKKEEEEKEDI